MDWLEHALRQSPYIFGTIAGVVTFGLLRVLRSKPMRVRTTDYAVGGVGFGLLTVFEAMGSWPPRFVQSEVLVGTILACFLIGLMLSRLGAITFDPASRELVLEQSKARLALTALFAGVFVAGMPLFYDAVGGGDPMMAAWCAFMAGGALSQWQRIARAEAV